ncbi:MAG: cardiolipin synthase [Microlunatus sp.]|nr:cardiolipin synthase [Microlunatus sp.]MDN5770485.1 cardiolipin synthase [Microlunatus sp.]
MSWETLTGDRASLATFLVTVILILNIFLAIIPMFRERREPNSLWAWILVMFFVPVLGFVLWLLVGRRLSEHKIFAKLEGSGIDYDELVSEQRRALTTGILVPANEVARRNAHVVELLLSDDGARLSENNHVQVFHDGQEKFDQLVADIEAATDHVHVYYYIFRGDALGTRIIEALTDRARAGVEVLLFWDALGGRTIHKSDLTDLLAAGGKAATFFKSRVPFINLRVNNRTHRKLVVIDGEIGYIGGFNVGVEYLGLNPKFGYWRDTHLRVRGSGVAGMQRRLLTDWNAAAEPEDRVTWRDSYFVEPAEPPGQVALQIAASGPDSQWERIKFGYIKMIDGARRSVWIQSPYFMPDFAVLDALKIAARSGLDVRLMIPDKPDHLLVYPATLSYADELAEAGARIFIYRNGFLHAKTVLVDHEMGSVGTANMDYRSFRLNFEVNAFFYDADLGGRLRDIYLDDLTLCTPFDRTAAFGNRYLWALKEGISRLVSPLL